MTLVLSPSCSGSSHWSDTKGNTLHTALVVVSNRWRVESASSSQIDPNWQDNNWSAQPPDFSMSSHLCPKKAGRLYKNINHQIFDDTWIWSIDWYIQGSLMLSLTVSFLLRSGYLENCNGSSCPFCLLFGSPMLSTPQMAKNRDRCRSWANCFHGLFFFSS